MIEFCDVCQKKRNESSWRTIWDNGIQHICGRHFKSTSNEHVPQALKDDRKKYSKSLLQPWREGEPSAEFMKAYPERAKKMFSAKEQMKAKNVWKDILPNGWEGTK